MSQPKIKADLERLCQEATRLGASGSACIPAAEIVLDDRALLKCMVPLCSHYGVDLMCPPNVLGIAQFRQALSRYSDAILVKVDIPSDALFREGSPDPEYVDSARNARKKLHDIVCRLESMSLQSGYPFAAGLIGGSCPLCEACVGVRSGLPCRHPFKARPAMEAVGINVVATADKAGLPLSFDTDAGRSWLGLVLVD